MMVQVGWVTSHKAIGGNSALSTLVSEKGGFWEFLDESVDAESHRSVGLSVSIGPVGPLCCPLALSALKVTEQLDRSRGSPVLWD